MKQLILFICLLLIVSSCENTEVTEEQKTELEEPNLHRLKVNGQEIEVSLDELKAGYSRDSDYRQKTHSLSMERKDLETQKESLRQSYDNRSIPALVLCTL